MAKTPSKKITKEKKQPKPVKKETTKIKQENKEQQLECGKKKRIWGKNGRVSGFLGNIRERWREHRARRYLPHRSFRRSYREDYMRETNVPGVTHHIFATFGILIKNWKLFLPLLILMVALNVVLVGMMTQEDYASYQEILDDTSVQVAGGDIGSFARAGLLLISTVTSGGLSGESSESAVVFGVLIFIVIWLTTIFLIRHIKAGHPIKLRDALYNAMAPLISTLMIFLVALLQCLPIFAFVVVLSAAVQTEFLATPFYALVFFIFAVAMFSLSLYMLSSSLMALVAVSAPGLYPLKALNSAADLMMGRRIKLIIRLIALIIVVAIMWVIIMMPMILFDLWMKQWEWTAGIPFVPICLVMMTSVTEIYLSAYLYLYYRWMLEA